MYNCIEQRLKSMSPSKFEKLVDQLLIFEGYKILDAPGRVIGFDKTKGGCPDSFFEDGNKYIFCEKTTEQNNLLSKLKKDIKHCFECENIENKRISKIILAFNSTLKNEKHINTLKNYVKQFNEETELELYNIHKLTNLSLKYPGIEYFLPDCGINTNIKSLNVFIEKSKKGIQPSLKNEFLGRKNYIKKILTYLETENIIVLLGKSGLGKTKLACKIAKELEFSKNYTSIFIEKIEISTIKSIYNSIPSNSNVLIVLDDLNGDFKGLEKIIQEFQNNEFLKVKFIIATRDYFKENLDMELINFKKEELELKKMDREEIIEISKNILNKKGFIPNLQILEKIVKISKGNPRIAIMTINNSIEKGISPKSTLEVYRNYFKNIERYNLIYEENFFYLGILSFFENLKKEDESLKKILNENFQINWESMWNSFEKLSKNELIDLYKFKIVRINDQVLSNYAIYELFFENKKIDFKKWVEIFIKENPQKLYEKVIELTNTFSKKSLKIDKILFDFQKNNEDGNSLRFYEIFWYYFEEDTILFLENWVEKLEVIKDPTNINEFTCNNNKTLIYPSKELKLLSNFFEYEKYFKESFKIGLKFISKDISKLNEFSNILFEKIKFSAEDIENNYNIQTIFVDCLISEDLKEYKIILDKIFLEKISELLKYEETDFKPIENKKFIIRSLKLLPSESLKNLRRNILEYTFKLYDLYPQESLKIIESYIFNINNKNQISSIYTDEIKLLSNFFINYLKTDNYKHCKLAKKYVNKFNEPQLKQKLDSFLNSNILIFGETYFLEIDWKKNPENQKKMAKEKINEEIQKVNSDNLKTILDKLNDIFNLEGEYNLFLIDYLFESIITEKPKLLYEILEYCIISKHNYPLKYITCEKIILQLFEENIYANLEIFEILNKEKYTNKNFFMHAFFKSIKKEDMTKETFYLFNEFIKNLENYQGFNDLKIYKKYDEEYLKFKSENKICAKNIISYITSIVIANSIENNYLLESNFIQKYYDYFIEDFDILKEIFFILSIQNKYTPSEEFELIFKEDYNFLYECLKNHFESNKYIEFNINLSCIWDYEDSYEYIKKSADYLISKSYPKRSIEPLLICLFKDFKENQKNNVKKFLCDYINENIQSKGHISEIMDTIKILLDLKEFLMFFEEILKLNPKPEILKNLSIGYKIMNGSWTQNCRDELKILNEIYNIMKDKKYFLKNQEYFKYLKNEINKKEKELETLEENEFEEDFI